MEPAAVRAGQAGKSARPRSGESDCYVIAGTTFGLQTCHRRPLSSTVSATCEEY